MPATRVSLSPSSDVSMTELYGCCESEEESEMVARQLMFEVVAEEDQVRHKLKDLADVSDDVSEREDGMDAKSADAVAQLECKEAPTEKISKKATLKATKEDAKDAKPTVAVARLIQALLDRTKAVEAFRYNCVVTNPAD